MGLLAAGIRAPSAMRPAEHQALAPDWQPSPNYGPRRDGLRPSLIVVHYTAMQSAQAALERLISPLAEVSAHYLIAESGRAVQMVAEDQRAWHAGAGEWRGMGDINSRSIGIELANTGSHPFPEPQMMALEALLRVLMVRWQIPARGVIGHSDMAPGRKSDPGRRFDWLRLERQGLAAPRGRGPAPAHADPQAFRALARAAGYSAPVDDDTLLAAVRLRFRPQARGPLVPADFRPLTLAPPSA